MGGLGPASGHFKPVQPRGRGAGPPACLLYTSGTTGRPKGVAVTHRTVVNFLASMAREPGLTSQDRLLPVTTLTFDIAVPELFLPLTVGARVVVASREQAADGRRLADLVSQCGITVLQGTPATWRLLLEAGWPDGGEELKVLCGGEAMPGELADRLLRRTPELWNLYGPTETTVWSAVHRVRPGEAAVSIGRPVARTQIHLLDPRLRPVALGVAGELHIGGAGLARGYHGRPALSAEKFIPDPFAPEPGRRLYATGDLARYLADGTLDFLGRRDQQVKVRGFRIELRESEIVLSEHLAVAQAAVVARPDAAGDQRPLPARLVAYVASRAGAVPSGELRDFLKDRLPDYMLPSLFVDRGWTPSRSVVCCGSIRPTSGPPPPPATRRGPIRAGSPCCGPPTDPSRTSRRPAASSPDSDLGWSSPAPVEVHTVPGDHVTLLAPAHVGELAARLRRCLD